MIKLFLMTQKGYDVLHHIIKSDSVTFVSAVVGSRDGSVKMDYYDEIQKICTDNSIPFFDRKDGSHGNVKSIYELAISWRWLIHESENLIVMHDSLLPKYRGFAPLVNCLKNGEREIGVTALFADSEYDKGDIICSEKTSVHYPIKISEAIDLVSACYIGCVEFIFKHIVENRVLPRTKQKEDEATYSLWLDDDDYQIDWMQDSVSLKRFVDALGWPYKGASTFYNGIRVRILEVEVVDDVFIENRVPGKVILINNGYPVVVCGKGQLKIKNMTFESGESALPLKKFRTRFNSNLNT